MRYYTKESLSARQHLTPEGFLVCENVPIARTGQQLYAAGEVPIAAAPSSAIVRIERTADQVFRPETMASFEGKAVTFDHPMMDVTASNWSKLAKGIVQNVRRGQGADHDLLIADLLITDADTIGRVRDKDIREVSCGYDADYEQTAPGYGRQINIVGNHVALVEQGRCGTRCAIGDSQTMKTPKWMDKLRAAFKARDEAGMEAALEESTKATADEAEAEETEEEKKKREEEEAAKKTGDSLANLAATLDSLNARLAALETRDAKSKDEDEDEDGEKKKTEDEKEEESEEEKKAAADKKAKDSAALVRDSQDVFARAEILSPGLKLPTFDAASDPAKVQDSLCALKRAALEAAFSNPKTRDAVSPLLTGVNVPKLTCDALHATFVGASEIVRRVNNAQTTVTFDSAKSASSVATTISAMNRQARDFWARN